MNETCIKDTWKSLLHDLFTLLLLIVFIVVPIRMFVVSPFKVDGLSMYPTFDNGNYLIVDRLIYNFKPPQRGDVIVFNPPRSPSTYYIKRIIGLPGENISIDRGVVTITPTTNPDKKSEEKISLTEPYTVNDDATYTQKISLSPEEYFVMGDNRPNSSDSRVFGPLPKKNIIGRVDVRLYPPSMIGFLPGSTQYSHDSHTVNSVKTIKP